MSHLIRSWKLRLLFMLRSPWQHQHLSFRGCSQRQLKDSTENRLQRSLCVLSVFCNRRPGFLGCRTYSRPPHGQLPPSHLYQPPSGHAFRLVAEISTFILWAPIASQPVQPQPVCDVIHAAADRLSWPKRVQEIFVRWSHDLQYWGLSTQRGDGDLSTPSRLSSATHLRNENDPIFIICRVYI